jgi:NADH:ubiquinone oxidoreductase subunit 6 (subunit J)
MMAILIPVLAGAVMVLVAFVAGIVVGMKCAHKFLEREGRLSPRTPPAVARESDQR